MIHIKEELVDIKLNYLSLLSCNTHSNISNALLHEPGLLLDYISDIKYNNTIQVGQLMRIIELDWYLYFIIVNVQYVAYYWNRILIYNSFVALFVQINIITTFTTI